MEYETENYTIRKIPLNYRIDIKKSLVLKDSNGAIERDWYCDIEKPLEEAIRIAEYACADHFRPMTVGEKRNSKKNSERMRRINLATRLARQRKA